MSKFVKFLVCLIFLKILLVSTQEGNSTFLISGGYRPRQHKLAKYMVSIQKSAFSKYFGSNHFCAGSILAPRVILTAAHCFWDKISASKREKKHIQIVAKTPNRLKKSRHTEIIKIQDIILHPKYDSNILKNDIAVVHLASSIHEDGVYAQRIKIPASPVKVETKCTVLGWGRVFEDGPRAADALYADIYKLAESKCKIVYRNLTRGSFCAGDLKDLEKDACKGDSGGPLICNGKITGIVSYGSGFGCGVMPEVYADVWYYRDWILKVSEISKCVKSANSISMFKVFLLQLLVWIAN